MPSVLVELISGDMVESLGSAVAAGRRRALRRVAGESCAFRFDWVLNGPRRATDLMNGFTVAEHVGILRVKALPELRIRVVLRIAPARPIVLRDESGVPRREPYCRA